MTNLSIALTTVARFMGSCRASGWSTRPAYMSHIYSACRAAGMDVDAADKFAQAWARDCGGPGPAALA